MDTETQTARFIIANVAHKVFEGPGGAKTFSGTRHFSAGTRVCVASAFWGDAGERVQVVGPARKSRRWIHVAVAATCLYNFRVAAVGKPAALRKLRAVGSDYLLFPKTEENLASSAVSLSRYYWLQALRSRITEALGEDRAKGLLGARWDRFDYDFCIHYVRRRKLEEAEQVAAEGAARDLVGELPTAELDSEDRRLLDRACRLSELWAMNAGGG